MRAVLKSSQREGDEDNNVKNFQSSYIIIPSKFDNVPQNNAMDM